MPKPKDSNAPTVIYLLRDAQGKPFYVGQAVNLNRRLEQHNTRRPVAERYSAEVLETVPNGEADAAEKRWISAYLTGGLKLQNVIHNPDAPRVHAFYWQVRKDVSSLCILTNRDSGRCASIEPGDPASINSAAAKLLEYAVSLGCKNGKRRLAYLFKLRPKPPEKSP